MTRIGAFIAALAVLFCAIGLAQDGRRRNQESAEDIFKRLDRNGDNRITPDEMRQGELFKALDTNGDGQVTLDEAKEYVSGRRGQPEPESPDMKKSPDIQYAKDKDTDPNLLSLDIYAPEDAKSCPVMVYVHGGGWSKGDKRAIHHKAEFFVGEGYVFVSVNYRLVPKIQHPTNVQDVANALAWVHSNIEKYGGDPEWIFLMGHSAGAHLVALAGTDGRRLETAGKNLSILKGVIPLDTNGYDLTSFLKETDAQVYRKAFGTDPEVWKDASPAAHVAKGKGIPPFLIFVANNPDKGERSEEFAGLLKAAGVEAKVVYAPEHNHGSLNQTLGKPGEKTTQDIGEFLNSVMHCFRLAYTHPEGLAQATALLDMFGNGRLGLAIASKRQIHFVRNRGNSQYEHYSTKRVDNANGWGLHDFNLDGRMDLFIAQQHKSMFDSWLNKGDGTFEPKDLGNETKGNTRNVIFADFDGDGRVDSYHSVSSFGTNHNGCELHAGKPDGTFGPDIIEEVLDPKIPGFWYAEANHPTRGKEKWANKMFKGAVVRDFDGDGRPDIVTGAYSDRGFQEDDYAFNWVNKQDRGLFILHNKSKPGKIRFAEVAKTTVGEFAYGDTEKDWNVYSVIPIDYDRDGDFDLFAGAVIRSAGRGRKEDTVAVRFFENVSKPGTIKFLDKTREAGFAYINEPEPAKRAERSLAAGAPIDFDNDGFIDLVLVNRRDMDKTAFAYVHLFRNLGNGTFEEVPCAKHGLGSGSGGRDLCCGDLNGDGLVDVVVNDGTVGGYDGLNNSRIYENTTKNDNHWIKTEVVTGEKDSPATGARVWVYEAGTEKLLGYDEIRTDFCYRSKRSATLHFGLGDVDRVDVRFQLRDGFARTCKGLSADKAWILSRAGEPRTKDKLSADDPGERSSAPEPADEPEREGRGKTLREALEELDLSPQQKRQAGQVLRRYRGDRQNPALTRELEKILTPEQMKKLQEALRQSRRR